MKKIILVLFLIAQVLSAKELTYRKIINNKSTELIISFEKGVVHIKDGSADAFIYYDENGLIRSYSFTDSINAEQGCFSVKDGRVISSDGKILENIDFKKEFWMQSVELAKDFILSKNKKLNFFIVGAGYDKKGNFPPGELSKMELYLEKKGYELKEINGVKIPCVKVLYTTKNKFMSVFRRNSLWYRKSDGVMVAGEVWSGVPGGDKTFIELILEK